LNFFYFKRNFNVLLYLKHLPDGVQLMSSCCIGALGVRREKRFSAYALTGKSATPFLGILNSVLHTGHGTSSPGSLPRDLQ